MSPSFFYPISTCFSLPKSEFPATPKAFCLRHLPPHKSVAGSKADSDTFPWKNRSQHYLRWWKSHDRTKPARCHHVLSSLWFLCTDSVSVEAGLTRISSIEYSKHLLSSLIPTTSWEPPPQTQIAKAQQKHRCTLFSTVRGNFRIPVKEQHPSDRCMLCYCC